MNPDFFERLYRGYAAEHFVSAQLFERSYECFRLPADFGLDLVVTNQFRLARGEEDGPEYFPFALQVKSRWVRTKQIGEGPNRRPQVELDFRLKDEELELLCEHVNSAIAFVLHWPVGEPLGHEPKLFLIHSSEIEGMRDRGYFRQDGHDYVLTVRHRTMPLTRTEDMVARLREAGEISVKAAEELVEELPPVFRTNWNAHPYYQFARESRTPDWPHLVWRAPHGLHTDFASFPEFERLQGLD